MLIRRATSEHRIPRSLSIAASVVALLWLVLADASAAQESKPTADDLEFFEKQVRPLLAQHCYSCHSSKAKKLQAGLLADSRVGLINGGDSGEAIVPFEPETSLFMEAVRYESYEMPPKGRLSDHEIATFEKWIKIGAPWPQESAPTPHADEPAFDLPQRKIEHWVWQSVQSPDPPDVEDQSWPLVELDHFILAGLERKHLQPSGDADPMAIARRLYLDLTGLPPTDQQVAALADDQATDAIERLVDQLLDSPQFGERWGRHWLDLVRYAESRGHEFDNDSPNAYQYRDYMIRALNADIPYDQIVREHIAGDLLPEPRLNPDNGLNESILGTGFWFLGEWVHSPVDIRKDEADRFDNMVDVMSKTFLGVTVSCARCHDHKFDAISTDDYYSLTGFLQSSDYRQVRFESMQNNGRVAADLARLDAMYRQRVTDTVSEHDLARPNPEPLPMAIEDLIVHDYQSLSAEQYRQDGYIFGDRPRRAGDAYLDTSGDTPTIGFSRRGAATSDPIWNDLESLTEKGVDNRSKLVNLMRSGRTLRTPTFELKHRSVVCRVRGEGHVVACVDSHRLIAGPLHGQTVQPIKKESPWVELDLSRYIGHRLHLEFTPAAGRQLEVSWVISGTKQETQAARANHDISPATLWEEFLKRTKETIGERLQELADSWAQDREQLKTQIVNRSHTAMAMMDGTGEDAHVLIRGNASKPGDVVPRHFLTAVAGDRPMEIRTGSGRLQLASQINDPDNPLTSRVIVNRIWHYLMGRGIVPTTDDFGVLGQRPTHPALLDFLATRFNRDGRSIKRMIRYIVSSRTYQMSSAANLEALESDPKNLLWHHRPPKRLEGEVIRDSLLALSGRLDMTAHGEPIPIHLTTFMDGRGRPKTSGPIDGDGRRSIYIAVRRNFISPFMLAFDTPVPFSTMGRRNSSNVPAQSLILMNDPFVVEQARLWAERAIQRSENESTLDRIQWMYTTAFSRQPTVQEVAVAQAYLQGDEKDADKLGVDRWADFAHALINTKEFIFQR